MKKRVKLAILTILIGCLCCACSTTTSFEGGKYQAYTNNPFATSPVPGPEELMNAETTRADMDMQRKDMELNAEMRREALRKGLPDPSLQRERDDDYDQGEGSYRYRNGNSRGPGYRNGRRNRGYGSNGCSTPLMGVVINRTGVPGYFDDPESSRKILVRPYSHTFVPANAMPKRITLYNYQGIMVDNKGWFKASKIFDGEKIEFGFEILKWPETPMTRRAHRY